MLGIHYSATAQLTLWYYIQASQLLQAVYIEHNVICVNHTSWQGKGEFTLLLCNAD